MKPFIALLIASLVIALGGCKKEPENWKKAAEAAEKKLDEQKKLGDKAPKQVEGKKLNAFFPEKIHDAERKFTTEKDGYVEANYEKGGETVATVVIADISDNPSSKNKFEKSSEKLAGVPLAKFGKRQSMVLVADRYQVKVTSSKLSHDERKPWLEKVDLKGLAQL